MPVGSSSRVYNSSALEVWFGHLAREWETLFFEDALRRGREIYRNGQISGIELTDRHAVIHCTFARKDTCYVVLEWDSKDKPSVRCSKEDASLGNAVAVGGLYEIEELIADEIDPLPCELKSEELKAPDVVSTTLGKVEDDEPKDSVPARILRPCFGVFSTSLRLAAYWVDAKSNHEAAFREGAVLISGAERELIVRLTALAKKAGFKFRRESNDFLMSDPECIAVFFASTYKRWESVFKHIDLNPDAQCLAEGVKQIKLTGSAKSVGKDSMRIDWRLKMGNRWLDMEDAVRLARIGSGTHVVKGLGLVRIAEEQAQAFNEWKMTVASATESGRVWPRYMVFSLFGEHGAELSLEQALQDWQERIQVNNSGSNDLVKPTPGNNLALPDFLRPYQAYGVRWMANLRTQHCHGLLADEMGLGKTVQILTLLREYPFEKKDSLVVCPASVVPVWQSEARHWYPEMDVGVLRSGETFAKEVGPKSKLWIASYTQLRRHKHLLSEVEFGYAVLDEAQQIKNPEAKVTHACCAIRAECRFALTGTPIENRLLDMWTIFRFIMPGLLGSRRRFEAVATSTDPKVREQLEQTLRKQIAPFLLRRKKDEVAKDLPPKVEMDLVCPITDTQRQVYERLLNESRETMGDDLQAIVSTQSMNFFTLLTRFRQVCCDPGLLPNIDAAPIQSGKVQMLLTRLSEALTGKGSRKVVIFSQFVQLLKRVKPLIEKEFPEVCVLELTGQTKNRSKPVEMFQKSRGAAVILVSLRAGGTGITLHAADYVFLLDPWWNPAIENQAIDRVHRIGQRKRVFVYRMITKGTIEERIQQLKAEKRELFENTLSDLGRTSDLIEHFKDLRELAGLL